MLSHVVLLGGFGLMCSVFDFLFEAAGLLVIWPTFDQFLGRVFWFFERFEKVQFQHFKRGIINLSCYI